MLLGLPPEWLILTLALSQCLIPLICPGDNSYLYELPWGWLKWIGSIMICLLEYLMLHMMPPPVILSTVQEDKPWQWDHLLTELQSELQEHVQDV